MNETPDKLTDESDTALNHLLGRLPSPQMPGDLSARIVRDVTRLPQLTAEEETDARPAAEPVRSASVTPITSARPHRRWIAWAGGGAATALAAGLATLALLPGTVERQAAPSATVAETAPAAKAEGTAVSAASSRPELAETTPTASAPQPSRAAPNPKASPVTAPPSKVEVAESGSAEASAAQAQITPTDSIDADDNAELVDGANLGIPEVTGQAPPAPGWGYAPGSSTPAIRRSEDDQGDANTGIDIRRHRGPPSPRRGF